MATQASNDDCYFYFYSSCTKGNDCPFRHCELALGTETVCSQWREGACFRSNCKFRHMESRINRATIQCYWENQPGGCRKPHCVFFHTKLREGIQSNGTLILPLSNGPAASSPKHAEVGDQVKSSLGNSPQLEGVQEGVDDFVPDIASVTVPPVVVNFDEESDTESVSSTPVKASSSDMKYKQSSTTASNLSSKFLDIQDEKDLGIKTLEQIKMEKIHKESEHFYKSAYDAPCLPISQTEPYKKECYPPKSEFISLPAEPSLEKIQPASDREVAIQALEKESDLRRRLTKRIAMPVKVPSEKKVSSFKKLNNKTENNLDFDFKIKTLDEIRKERENKQGGKLEINEHDFSNSSEEKVSEENENSTRKLKNYRIPKEPCKNSSGTKEDAIVCDVSMGNDAKDLTVSIEVQAKASDPSSNLSKMEGIITFSSEGKRKKYDSKEERAKCKVLKTALRQNFSNEQKLGRQIAERQMVKSLRPFLRRPKMQYPVPLDKFSVISVSSPTTSVPVKEEKDGSAGGETLSNSNLLLAGISVGPLQEPGAMSSLANIGGEDMVPAIRNLEIAGSMQGRLLVGGRMPVMEGLGRWGPRPISMEERSRSRVADKLSDESDVDELDHLLSEADMNVDEMDDIVTGDDILLEIEQFLDS